jgi:hypothetical protein
MPRAWCYLTMFAVFLNGAMWYGPATSWATLYQCTDASGAQIFTDSLTQLEKCTPMKPSIAAEPPSRSTPPKRAPRTSRSQQVRPAPPAQRTQPSPERKVRPRRQGETQSMFRSRRATPQSGAPSGKQPEAAQRCANPINPLNPLLSIPCGQPQSE